MQNCLGSSSKLYDSVWNKIFSLPEDYLLFPAHDYNGQTCSSVAEEKKFNSRLTKSKEEFKVIMSNLNLEKPKLIGKKNLFCFINLLFDKAFHKLFKIKID